MVESLKVPLDHKSKFMRSVCLCLCAPLRIVMVFNHMPNVFLFNTAEVIYSGQPLSVDEPCSGIHS